MKKLLLILLVPSIVFSSVDFKEKLNNEIQKTKSIQKDLNIYNKKNIEMVKAEASYNNAVNEYNKSLIKSKDYIKYISFTDRKQGLRKYFDIRVDNYRKGVSAQKLEFKNDQLKQNILDIIDLLITQVPNIIIGLDENYNVLINEEKL